MSANEVIGIIALIVGIVFGVVRLLTKDNKPTEPLQCWDRPGDNAVSCADPDDDDPGKYDPNCPVDGPD